MLSNNSIFWIWLMELPGIGTVTVRMLWEHFGDVETIYGASPIDLMDVPGIHKQQINVLTEQKKMNRAKEVVTQCKKLGIDICTADMQEYPKRCLKMKDISPVLYMKGENKLNAVQTVGIIGKRRCSQLGKERTIFLAEEKCRSGYAVVSGFAKGIDSYAHTAAIKANGYTIGVLGNGIDVCYPPEQIALKDKIEEMGLLITQYPPGTIPQKYTFPTRNKLIAALSDELYVIETSLTSGTRSTIEAAEKYNRNIYTYEKEGESHADFRENI